jgi:hypothetical protein
MIRCNPTRDASTGSVSRASAVSSAVQYRRIIDKDWKRCFMFTKCQARLRFEGINFSHLTCSKFCYIYIYMCVWGGGVYIMWGNVRPSLLRNVLHNADGVGASICAFLFVLSFVRREYSCWKRSICARVSVRVGFVSGCDYIRELYGCCHMPLSFNARTTVCAAETQRLCRQAAWNWRWRWCDWSLCTDERSKALVVSA